jgi:serine/threonine protein kinase
MSLVIYDTESIDSSRQLVIPDSLEQLEDEIVLHHDNEGNEYCIILNNVDQRMLVLQNQMTNELQLIDRDSYHNNYDRLNSEASTGMELKLREPFDEADPRVANDAVLQCPHCGNDLISNQHSNTTENSGTRFDTRRRGSSNGGLDNSFIHHSYFKLLESNIYSKLPNTVFSQGYYEHFFKEIKLLGRGSRGSVYLVQHILNDFELGQFALKKITIGDDPKWLISVLNEVHMLVNISVNNVNLVSYNHVWLEVDSINEFGPRVPCAFILQQYCSGGSLEDFIDWLKEPKLSVKEMKKYKIRKVQGRLLSQEEILKMFKDIVNGVYELHKHHIIHRDLKPSNCLLSDEYKFDNYPSLDSDVDRIPTILIGDFGESQLEGEKRNASGSTGTLEYCAPELFAFNEFSKKTDVYSLGMILYHMCFGKLPFKSTGFDVDSLRKEIGNFHENLEKSTRDDLDNEFIQLIKFMTFKDPIKRLNTDQILERIDELKSKLIRNRQSNDRKLSIDGTHDQRGNYQNWILVHGGQILVLSLVLQRDIWPYLKYLAVFINGLVWFEKRPKVISLVMGSMVVLYLVSMFL